MTDKKTVLVVDDTPENIDILTGILSPEYKVKAAVNGERALKSAALDVKPDLILLDIMMPEMDGYEVCRRLKANKRTKDIPVIFVTAKGQTDDETLGFEVGAIDYITKPVRPAIVEARVRNIIALHQTQKRLQETLNKTLTGSIELMMDVLSMINPTAFGRSRNLRRHVISTAKRLGHQKTWTFEVAAMLSQIGCITLPTELLEKIYNGEAVSDEEQTLFDNHPLVGKRLLEKIPNFQEAAAMIALQNSELEELDEESGSASQVQLGASLLQVALHLDDMDRKRNPVASVSTDQKPSTTATKTAVATKAVERGDELTDEEQTVALSDLHTGLVLNCDVTTRKGMMLMKQGTEVTKAVIERLQGFESAGMLKEKTFKVVAIEQKG